MAALWVGLRPARAVRVRLDFLAACAAIGKPGPDGVSPRGWVIYAGLGQCSLQAPQEEGGS
jgi:hypothetical protein